MNANLMESVEYPNVTSPDDDAGEVVVKRDLAMLGHVAVRLEVVLGETTTSVDELFALTAGSLLKLDTELEAAVALQLNGKTIAKGHLVAIDDHFGIKIIEID